MDRLCGGTFFTLLCCVKRRGGQTAVFLGEKAKLSEPGMLEGLLRLMNSDYRIIGDSTMKTKTSYFKACRSGSTSSIPLDDSRFKHRYHNRVRAEFSAAVADMREFVHIFLREEDQEALLWLTCALLRLLQGDDTIPDSALLYPLPDGRCIGKMELLEQTEISLPILLTCVWHYITYHVPDNGVGRETILRWIGEKEIANTIGEIPEEVGASIGNLKAVVMEYVRPELTPEGVDKRVTERESDDHQDAPDTESRAQRQDQTRQIHASNTPVGSASAPFFLPMPQPFAGQHYINQGIVFNAPAQIQNLMVPGGSLNTGIDLFEMQALSKDYYHLIVLEGEDLTTNVFCVLKQRIFTEEGTSKEDKNRFISMSDAEIRQMLAYPAVIAIRNRARKRAGDDQMAILGKLTEIRIQRDNVKLQWKMYRLLPQSLLNQHMSDFGIYFCTLSNELDKEHWAIKPCPLFERLRDNRFDPFQTGYGALQYSTGFSSANQTFFL